MHVIHMFVTILTVLGLMFAVTATVQYYDVVCWGERNLCHRWMQCLCCKREVKAQHRGRDIEEGGVL